MARKDEPFETEHVGNLTVKLYPDFDPQNPREDDNMGTMVCWHRNYDLGDKHAFESPEDFRESLEYLDAAIILPLYLYDHGGITIRVSEFADEWDSGQVGYVYVSRAKLREEYSVKRVSKQTLAKATGVLKAEVETYAQYLEGDVWGYVVSDSEGNHLDSCWGFFGLEYARGEAMDAAKSQLEYWTREHAKIDALHLEA